MSQPYDLSEAFYRHSWKTEPQGMIKKDNLFSFLAITCPMCNFLSLSVLKIICIRVLHFLPHKTYSYQFPKGTLTVQERKAMRAVRRPIKGVSAAEQRSKLREIKVRASGVGCKVKSPGSSGGAWHWPDTGAQSTQTRSESNDTIGDTGQGEKLSRCVPTELHTGEDMAGFSGRLWTTQTFHLVPL